MEEGRSAIWARLDGVEKEFARLQNERDQAILERDQARAVWVPILEQVEKLRETVLGQLPKRDTKLPSARTAFSVTPEMVDGWAELYEGGMSLTRIAREARTGSDTVSKYLRERGIETRGKRQFGHGSTVAKKKGQVERVPRCKECDLPMDSPALTNSNVPPPVDGVCGLCQFIGADLAEKRARAKEGNGNHGGI